MKHTIALFFVLTALFSYAQNTTVDELFKRYNSGDYKLVIEKAQPLREMDRENVDLNLIIGRSLTDLQHYETAVKYLETAVNNDKTNSWRKAWGLGYLGTCFFMLENYENSENSINECIRLNATKNATNYAYGASLLFGYNKFYDNWKLVESENFRFHFQNMSEPDIKNYIASREAAFQNINQFFTSELPRKIDFFVWDSKEDAKNLLNANLGFARPAFCIVHSHYQQTRGHEMTHVISNYSSEIQNKTNLINEGTAVRFDQTNRDKEKAVKEWIKTNGQKVAVTDVWANWTEYPEELTYPLSGLFVTSLIDNFGRDKFLEFFSNQSYENAKIIFGDKLDKVIADFENRINS